ncbi:MAG TPA: radical SAM protein [Candidatus Omnitrophota bacterium]|nr:radical SAM protein [Candidatus Omnitrophota bacterium]
MKIGLIAMSGIRACDAELLELGLTLPGFVERSKVIASLPSLGLLTLAGMTPKQHSLQYLEVADLRQLKDLSSGFDLIAISSYTAQIGEAYELADRYREIGIPVVMGGLHVSALPEEAALHCDAVVIGEGELSWHDVLKDRENKSLKQFYGNDSGDFDLSQSPVPAYELLDIPKYNRLTVQTSRGCPFQCEFCASSILLSKKYKQKPIKNVLAEIDKIKSIWKRPFIELADDNTFVDKNYWRELLPELKKRQVKWFTETDISVADDEALLRVLQESGCAEVLIGLESPIRSGLDGIERKGNWKLKRWIKYKDAVQKIQAHGIRVDGCFVVGLDGHGPDIFEEVYSFTKETNLFDVQITIPTPFPGTPFYDRLDKEGRLLEKNAWERCTLFDINFQPTGMTPEELRKGFINLGMKLYSGEFTENRRHRFDEEYKKYLHNRSA